MYTEDGTIILETDDLIDWAVQNYRSLMADHLERLYQGKQGLYFKVNRYTFRGSNSAFSYFFLLPFPMGVNS